MNPSNLLSRSLVFVVVLLVLVGCASRAPAPVAERRPPATGTPAPAPSKAPAAAGTSIAPSADASKGTQGDGTRTHTIQRGETLIAIALQYGLDYRELAMWNNIENPNVIKVGEVLRVTPPGVTESPKDPAAKEPKPGQPVAAPLVPTPMPSAAGERPAQNSTTSKVEPRGGKVPYADETLARLNAQADRTTSGAPAATPSTPGGPAAAQTPSPTPTAGATPAAGGSEDVEWSWPLKGKVIANFTEANKGIDIAGTKGAPVLSAAPGKVVYSGSGIRGYGRLVIVRHNATWLSAYAHNDKIVVNEGQEVKRGQKIAEVGNSDADQFKLHFEIRRQGRPVDPQKLLPAAQ
jgi:lipoprotein NlpD